MLWNAWAQNLSDGPVVDEPQRRREADEGNRGLGELYYTAEPHEKKSKEDKWVKVT